MKRRLLVSAAAAAAAALPTLAGTVVVTNPAGLYVHPGGGSTVTPDLPTPDNWFRTNVRAGTSVGITRDFARSGNGSAFFQGADGTSKADFELFFSDLSGRTLGNLSSLAFDWYRDGSSTAAAHLQPSLRLYVDGDGDMNTSADRGYLIWEAVYNSVSVLADTWVSSDALAGNFWLREFDPGHTVTSYNNSIAEWMTGITPAGSTTPLSANSIVFGLSFGIGSGWNGSFLGAVDNVTIGFGGSEDVYNFEVIPLPTAGLMGLAGMGLVASRRRTR